MNARPAVGWLRRVSSLETIGFAGQLVRCLLAGVVRGYSDARSQPPRHRTPRPGLATTNVPSMRINVYWLTPMSGFIFIGT
jgi:hypothetical protein